MQVVLNFLIGVGAGVVTGFGIGGGTLLVICLTLFMKYAQLEAQAINLVYFIPSAAAALISHIKNGRVDRSVSAAAGASGGVAALIAAAVATKTEASLLSRGFGAFLLIIATSEIIAFFKKRKTSPPK